MVNVTEAMESEYLTADVVKNSLSKRITILDGGKYEEATFDGKTRERLTIRVGIDGKTKIWRPNRDSVKNLSSIYGKDSEDWKDKQALLQIMSIQGKDCIIATATTPPTPEPEQV